MRLAAAVAATVLILAQGHDARAAIGLLNTRLDTGLDWYVDKPSRDAPVYPGFHVALSADGRLVPRLHFIVGGGIDAYRYGADEVRSQLFTLRGGLMFIPVDFDGGHGFVEATAGYARLHGAGATALGGSLGYLAQYGRLGIGLFTRYTHLLGQTDGGGHGVKALVFGISAGVMIVEPRRPPRAAPTPIADEDGDGVEDGKDKCPKTRRGMRVDADGCEVKVEVPEAKEAPKPEQAEETPADAPAAAESPPPPAKASDDDDLDGVLNTQDQCPNTTMGFPVDVLSGCPVLRRRFALPQVTFAPLTARIDKGANAQLDELALLLRDRPNVRLKITGYVQSAKDTPVRVIKRVSEERAEIVGQLLVARGLGAKRVRTAGSKQPDVDEIEVALSGSLKVVMPKLPKGKRPDAVAVPALSPGAPAITPPPAAPNGAAAPVAPGPITSPSAAAETKTPPAAAGKKTGESPKETVAPAPPPAAPPSTETK